MAGDEHATESSPGEASCVGSETDEPFGIDRIARRILRADLILWLVSAVVLLTWWQRPAAGPSDELAHVVLFASLKSLPSLLRP